MARTEIYIRSVDAIFTKIKLENVEDSEREGDSSAHGIEAKKGVKSNQNSLDDLPSVNINNRHQSKTGKSKNKYANDINENEESILHEKSTYLKNNIPDETDCKSSSKTHLTCAVCFVEFKNASGLKSHYTKMSIRLKCNSCNAIFTLQGALKKHIQSGCSTPSNSSKHRCNFCNRSFRDKYRAQCHILHIHGYSESSNDIETDENASYKSPEKLQCSNDTLKRDASSSPSKSPNDINTTPSKKMKQTSIAEFIAKGESKEMNIPDIKNNFIGNSYDATYESSKISDLVTNGTLGQKPFVQMHVDHSTMMSLSKMEVKTDPDNVTVQRDISYNLRRATINSTLRYFDDIMFPEDFKITRKSHRKRTTRSKPQLQEKDLKPTLKYEECALCSNKLNCEHKFLYNHHEEISLEDSDEQTIKKFKDVQTPNAIGTPLRKFAEQQSVVPEDDKIEDTKTKVFRCCCCSRTFSSRKLRYKHMRLSHTIYVSSICKARYTSAIKLLRHYLIQHTVSKENGKECCVCDAKFNTLSLFKRHVLLHCVKSVQSNKNNLPIDGEMNCVKLKKQYKCEGCGKRFWLNSCLKEHRNVCRRVDIATTDE